MNTDRALVKQRATELMLSDRVSPDMWPIGEHDIPNDVDEAIADFVRECSSDDTIDMVMSLQERWRQTLFIGLLGHAIYLEGYNVGYDEGEFLVEDDLCKEISNVVQSCFTKSDREGFSKIINASLKRARQQNQRRAAEEKKSGK